MQYEDFPWWGQLIVDVAEETIPIVIDELTQMAVQSFNLWLANRRQRKATKKAAKLNVQRKDAKKVAPATKAELIFQEQGLKAIQYRIRRQPQLLCRMNSILSISTTYLKRFRKIC